MKTKKLFSAMLMVVMMLSLTAVSALATEQGETSWYNNSETTFTITTAAQLQGFAELVNGGNNFAGKTVTLGNDIDLAGTSWKGIGVYSEKAIGTAFSGTFNGNGKTISNVTFASTGGEKYRGFFNQLYRATVKNVTIECDGFESGVKGGAVIAGHAIGSTIEDCVSEGTLSGTHNVAGIVVLIQGSTIKNCTNKANLENNYTKLAGIVNFSQHKGVDPEHKGSLIEGCVNEATVTSTGDGGNGVGGIVGWIGYGDGEAASSDMYTVTIKNCENKGTIKAAATTAPVGQIVGKGESYLADGGANKGLAGKLGIGSDNAGQYFAYAIVTDGVAAYTKTLSAGNTYLVTALGAKPEIKLAAGESITFDTAIAAMDASGITAEYGFDTVTDGSKTTYKGLVPVAKIGDVKYATLEAAINAASAGDEIEVIAEEIDFSAFYKDNLTFRTERKTKIKSVAQGVDGKNVGKGTTFDGFVYDCGSNKTDNVRYVAENLTIKNCEFTGWGAQGCHVIGTWTIENCTFNSDVYALGIDDGDAGSVVNVVDCTINGGFSTFGEIPVVNFKDCTFNKGKYYDVVQTIGYMTLRDCTFDASWPKGASVEGGTGTVGSADKNDESIVTEIYNSTYAGGTMFDLREHTSGIFVVNPRKNSEGKYTSGIFGAEPSADILAADATVNDNGNGTYTVSSEKIKELEISGALLESNDVTVEDNTYALGAQITVSEISGSKLKADYEFTHNAGIKAPIPYSLYFDITGIEIDGDADFGVVFYNIPSDWTVSAPTITIE